jgi:aryl carrier-like protein
MYETLRTSFVRDYNAVKRLEKELQNENLIKYGEKNIRNLALLEMFKFNLKYGLSLSLTDCIIREIIKSGRSNIKGLLTSNKKDFIDVCQSCKVEILDFS